MRTYQANLSRRLSPLFAELAMLGQTPTGRRCADTKRPFHELPKSNPEEKARRERERSKNPAKAYKPVHGGYPDA